MPHYTDMFQDAFALAIIVLFFGGSIFVHELGHFLAAKWRGLKVLKFSIGFGPKIFGWRGKDGCEYKLSLLPLGGYVALPQLADLGPIEGGSAKRDLEGMSESERLARTLPKISYADKMIVSVAGPFFNILFAFMLAIYVWTVGIPTFAPYNSPRLGYVAEVINIDDTTKVPGPAYSAGLRSGDIILTVDGTQTEDFETLMELVAMGSGRSAGRNPLVNIRAKRGDEILDFSVNPVLVKTNMQTGDEIRMIGVFPGSSMMVGAVDEQSPAANSGLRPGDLIKTIDGIPVYSNYQVIEILSKMDDAMPVKIGILRENISLELSATPRKMFFTRPLVEISTASKENGIISLINSALDEENPASTAVEGKLLVYDYDSSESGLKGLARGMVLAEAGGQKVSSLESLNAIVNAPARKGPLKMRFTRPDGSGTKDMTLPADAVSKLVGPVSRNVVGYRLNEERIIVHPSVGEQFVKSVTRTWSGLKSLVSPSSDIGFKHFSGPIGIGRVMYKVSFINLYEPSLIDFSVLFSFMVLVNINLAILNLLPIPVLDGGHILMATVSKIIGRPVPESFVGAVQGVFLLLFLTLMVYVMYFDVMRWKGDNIETETYQNEMTKLYYLETPKFK